MPINAAHWEIERDTGAIIHTGPDHGVGGESYATVIEFHRWLQGLADDAIATAASNDELDITNTNPSQRSTDNIITLINGYFINDNAAEHLYDGSIIQNGGDDIYDGIVNFGNADVQIRIIQNGAVISAANSFWNQGGAGLNADATSGISHRFMIKTRSGGSDIDGRKLIGIARRFGYTYQEFSINATARGNNVLALADATDLNNQTASGTVAGWSADFTNTEGYVAIDVDNDGNTTSEDHYYSSWNLNTGVHTNINDFYEYVKYLTRGGTSSTLYGLNGELFRGITHEVNITQTGGTFVEPESVSWPSGTGQLLAINSTSAGTKMWIQLLTGTSPTSTTITGNGGATATSTTVTAATISKPFVGASTGSALIGAYGLGIVATDLKSTDTLTDLEGNPQTPPNFVTNTVAGLIHNEDRVLVAPWDGTSEDSNGDKAINKNQLTLTSTLTGANVATIQVSNGDETAIPSDTPSTGVIRVTDDNSYERWIPYLSWTGTTFTVDTGHADIGSNNDFNGVTGSGTYQALAGNNVYVTYIDKVAVGSTVNAGSFVTGTQYVIKTVGTTDFTAIGASANTIGVIFTATGAGSGTGNAYTYVTSATFTSVQSGTRNLVVIVRDGGGTPIKQYIAPWTQTSSNSTTTVIRTSDT